MSFHLSSGKPNASYPLPDANAFCNDIAVNSQGDIFISDTHENAVYKLGKGSRHFETVAKDSLLQTVDGLSFAANDRALYVTDVTTGKLLRLNLRGDGHATRIVELKLSHPLSRPDGLRLLSPGRMVLAENGGTIDIVSVDPKNDTALIQPIADAIEGASAVSVTRGVAWVAEGKLKYWEDPNFMGKDPGKFQVVPVALPDHER